ncbi:MAG: proteasome accessory factor PafA2 family protein [Fimbriimonadaceae bacterium]
MSLTGPAGASAPAGLILAGIETEYGFTVEGRGADDQIEDATELVRGYPGPCFVGWDYCYESPRADLRGFRLDRLAVDPEDAKRDIGRTYGAPSEVRADRILPNGARFYNDHGHPEYATPECWSLNELVLHDTAGQFVLGRAGRALAAATGRAVTIYKNNTDFHRSSYGTHESYLAPRAVGFERLFAAITPMLIARQILCGAGKVGAEFGSHVDYQLTARADFFTEPVNAETLFRRPVFNTRDEPHAMPQAWIRLHVISGDANMIPSCTRRKVGLVKLALMLEIAGQAPRWGISHPVRAFQSLSRDVTREFRISLEGRNWTTAYDVIESYLAAAEAVLQLDDEMVALVAECRSLLHDLAGPNVLAPQAIDWVAKKGILDAYREASGVNWREPALQAYDLEYHNIDPADGLYFALETMEQVDPMPPMDDRVTRIDMAPERTRASARGLAVARFGSNLTRACWRTLTFNVEGEESEIELPPDRIYPVQLEAATDVGTFIQILRNL